MQGSTYPEGALPAPISRTPIVAAIVALLVGGAIATGIWWLTDNDVDILPEPATKVIVAQPGEAGAGTAAKDEAAVAAAVAGSAIAVNPSTGFAEATGGLSKEELGAAYGTSQYRSGIVASPPIPSGPINAQDGIRYDGGPEEGTAQTSGSLAGADKGP